MWEEEGNLTKGMQWGSGLSGEGSTKCLMYEKYLNETHCTMSMY